jgi:hypothetical protein
LGVRAGHGRSVGEAWGGDFLHLLGHAIGTVVVVGLVSLAVRSRAPWASRGAIAATIGSLIGLAFYLAIVALAGDTLGELTIALTLHLPLIAAATVQAWALRRRLRRPRCWALTWLVSILVGAGVAWYAGGGLDGASSATVHPVFERAVDYWWRTIPESALGALAFALLTAWTVPVETRVASH